MDFDIIKGLKNIAPLADVMLGGPWASLATKAIGAVFGHEGDTLPTKDEIAGYIQNATPEQLINLKKIDADLKVTMRELDIKESDLVYKDKDSARDMQKETKSKMPGLLAILLTIGFFGSLAAMMYFTIPEANKAIVYSMVGSLGTAWIAAMQFYFGTTQGSRDKNDMFKNNT